jgi:hypothetical protein
MAHTPGPWKVADRFYILMDDEVACEVAKVCDENIDDDMLGQCDADARLIAASPDLLAACHKLIDSDAAVEEDERKHQLLLAKLLAAAAIAKAEGRE